jgi:hypothetical protein
MAAQDLARAFELDPSNEQAKALQAMLTKVQSSSKRNEKETLAKMFQAGSAGS